jgi:exosortase/archaeosortase family protein
MRLLRDPTARRVARFLAVLAAIEFALFVLSARSRMLAQSILPASRTWTVFATGVLFRWTGTDATILGPQISVGRARLSVGPMCDIIQPFYVYVATVFAFPVSIGSRLRGALIGAAILFAANVLRLVVLVLAGNYAPNWFDSVHHWVWPLVIVGVTTGSWVAWARGAMRRDGLVRVLPSVPNRVDIDPR